jgi:hypothetical protein
MTGATATAAVQSRHNICVPSAPDARAIFFGFLHMLHHAKLANPVASRLYRPSAPLSYWSCAFCRAFGTAVIE